MRTHVYEMPLENMLFNNQSSLKKFSLLLIFRGAKNFLDMSHAQRWGDTKGGLRLTHVEAGQIIAPTWPPYKLAHRGGLWPRVKLKMSPSHSL